MEINEQWIKVGKLPVSIPLKQDGSIQVEVKGEPKIYHLTCVKIEHKSNQDGTEDVTYILKWNP